ncbi:quinohemoprotein amine dehydrogenase subunit alpha (plasmid) [Leisingera caerulea]|uniref:quinohemoprotein amine dehydrogenase subunit alpha n=1 Tax=Leisingera caerulea TaxID=506591 RepID=UPI0021A79BDA|nr:quinohemoprotein amine dehydrogenase subunit alpha [Leisingera caerulea]UWQ52261.1 quinohemoprotein amine dehydrogenase subunit alpha [Leisingera caerulea]
MQLRPRGLTAALLISAAGAVPAMASEELLKNACSSCHTAEEGGLSRISGQRKSPEGWMMTIVRMQQAHGLEISAEDRRTIVQHLADAQGLAPSEAAPFRYALEKDPNAQESFDEPFASMCARCHTGARGLLQNRTAEEWELHMDFHVGHFPTIEYQALGRDREWYKIARTEIASYLAEQNPLETAAWTDWQAAEKQPVAGDWVVMTDLPGIGEAYGKLTVTGDASPYQVSGEFVTADGTAHPASGQMNLYTGYEWRANLDIGGTAYRQVLALSEDGNSLQGRQFDRSNDALGAPLSGVRDGAGSVILGTVPSAVPAGEAQVQVVGTGLDGLDTSSGETAANTYGAALSLAAEGNGVVTFSAGGAEGQIAHYTSLDSLKVEPEFTIARVGGGSEEGPAAVPAYFNAVGMWNGPDGEAGTEDDVRIGRVEAQWTVANAHEHAAHMKDTEFAGKMQPSGIFAPAVAGPNPDRPFSANNAGELTVQAEAMGQQAEAMLIVTVQRFIDPPIR